MDSTNGGQNIILMMKELEEGKNILEKKNNEIIQLKKQVRDYETEKIQLKQQIEDLNLKIQEQNDQNQDFHIVLRRTSQTPQENLQLEIDFELFSDNPDPEIRAAIRNIQNKMFSMEKELVYRQTEAQIKKEQLEPYRQENILQKSKIQELDQIIQELNEALQMKDKQINQLYEQQNQEQELQSKMQMKPRSQIRNIDQTQVLQENSQTCTPNQPCHIF